MNREHLQIIKPLLKHCGMIGPKWSQYFTIIMSNNRQGQGKAQPYLL